jgi:hypothetical protein
MPFAENPHTSMMVGDEWNVEAKRPVEPPLDAALRELLEREAEREDRTPTQLSVTLKTYLGFGLTVLLFWVAATWIEKPFSLDSPHNLQPGRTDSAPGMSKAFKRVQHVKMLSASPCGGSVIMLPQSRIDAKGGRAAGPRLPEPMRRACPHLCYGTKRARAYATEARGVRLEA